MMYGCNLVILKIDQTQKSHANEASVGAAIILKSLAKGFWGMLNSGEPLVETIHEENIIKQVIKHENIKAMFSE